VQAAAPSIPGFGEIRHPGNNKPLAFIACAHRLCQMRFDAVELERRQVIVAVGELFETIRGTRNADKTLCIVVPGSNVSIADWPIHAYPFFGIGFEIEVT